MNEWTNFYCVLHVEPIFEIKLNFSSSPMRFLIRNSHQACITMSHKGIDNKYEKKNNNK